MTRRRELTFFGILLALLVAALLRDSLIGSHVLSPADTLLVGSAFRDVPGASDEPANRLLIDPVLQFQPWIELNRSMFRQGSLPLWNPYAGCGAPHLANGQSAAFDPFLLPCYLTPGSPARAQAWVAASRLWFSGIGMFLLARAWGLGIWGRWFSGAVFPFCGFLIGWLLFPVASSAAWFPWVMLAVHSTLRSGDGRSVAWLAFATAGTVLGGHIQTAAHVLLASGLYGIERLIRRAAKLGRRSGVGWRTCKLAVGFGLGLSISAIAILPLGSYLSRSPVWRDRLQESPTALALTRPRLLDSACTLVPYLYGSQRRGHPNLARALGVHNVNESAGGFAGLATALWLAPATLSRRKRPRVRFLWALTAFGFLGAFGFPPVTNLLRSLPVLDVIDQRRLTLWVAFGLTLLGGMGLDRMTRPISAPWRHWRRLWLVAGLTLLALAPAVTGLRSRLETVAQRHYQRAAQSESPADQALYEARANRQVEATLRWYPLLLSAVGVELLAMVALAALWSNGTIRGTTVRAGLLGITLTELFGFADGLNPAIPVGLDRPITPVVQRLREQLKPGERLIGIGQEFPPNVAMRYGLSDARNYDSIELDRAVRWLTPLFTPEPNRPITSRSTITWEGVQRALDRLRESAVAAVVSAHPPPPGLPGRPERCGSAWITWLVAAPYAELVGAPGPRIEAVRRTPGEISIRLTGVPNSESSVVVRETYDPGWVAQVDGRDARIALEQNMFMKINLGSGSSVVRLRYRPAEVEAGGVLSMIGLFVASGLVLASRSTRPRDFCFGVLDAPKSSR